MLPAMSRDIAPLAHCKTEQGTPAVFPGIILGAMAVLAVLWRCQADSLAVAVVVVLIRSVASPSVMAAVVQWGGMVPAGACAF